MVVYCVGDISLCLWMMFWCTGMIHVKEVLDRETESYYWLTVYAHDSAAVPRSSFVDVLIEVDDVNDNRPQTAQPVYYPTVLEASEEGTEIIQLQAFDHDMANGALTYDITSGNPQGFFSIDRLTGTLPLLTSALCFFIFLLLLFYFRCHVRYSSVISMQ